MTNSDVVSNDSDGVVQKCKKCKSKNYGERIYNEMNWFTAVLEKEEAAQRQVEGHRLKLEGKRLAIESGNNAANREDRRRKPDKEWKGRKEDRESRDCLSMRNLSS